MALKLSIRHARVRQKTHAIALHEVKDPAMRLLPRQGRNPCDADAKARLLEGMRAGRTQWEMLATDPTLPNDDTIYRARKADAQFDAEYQAARALGLANRIEEGVCYAGSVRDNKQLAIGAEKYMNAVTKAAQLLAPKTYGPMLKHADANGDKLTVTVTDYRHALEPVDASFVELPNPTDNK